MAGETASGNRSQKLPIVGAKLFNPTKSDLEFFEIQKARNELKKIIDEPRIELKNALICAEWEMCGRAKVVKSVGHFMEYFGRSINRQTYLHPEESLYLLETNRLQLFYEGVSISVQRCYSLCMQHIALHHYRVYSHLLSHGFKVFRHCQNHANAEDRDESGVKKRKMQSAEIPDFDAFSPDTAFKKTNKSAPDYYVIVLSESKHPIFGETSHSIPLLYAKVRSDSVAFFSLDSVEIPSLS